jgi:hypothetical protein
MKRVTLTAALVVTAAFATAAPAMASSGVAYLRSHQTASGGFANPGSPAGVTTTEWAVMGLRAAGINPTAMRRPGGKTPVGFLATSSRSWSGAYALERGILGVVALRLNPAKFAGRNLIKALRAQVVPASGRIGAYANSTFWGVIALRGARQTLPTHSIAYIKGRQQSNGGYSYLPTKPAGADSNDTAAAIMAMHAGGVPCSDVHIRRAIGYLSTTHIGGGGYALLPHGAADSQSTSWAVQARRACGLKNAAALRWLGARHSGDGSYYYAPGNHQTPTFVTGQVLPATNGKFYPVR